MKKYDIICFKNIQSEARKIDKIRLLAIAPYEGLRELFLETAKERDDIELTAYEGDMTRGVEIAASLPLMEYSAVISRAGTAELLEQISPIPVVDVGISVYDMLRAIRLAQNYEGKFAVIGYPMITGFAVMINDLLQYQADVFTVNDPADIPDCLIRVKGLGYRLVVGDVVTTTHAKRMGFNTILVTSGKENVQNAFDQCVRWYRNYSQLQARCDFYRAVIENSGMDVLVYDEKQRPLCSIGSQSHAAKEGAEQNLKKYVEKVLREGNQTFAKRIGNETCLIQGKRIANTAEQAAAFYCTHLTEMPKADEGIVSYRNPDDVPAINPETLASDSPAIQSVLEVVGKYSRTNFPVAICGPRGSGKGSYAFLLYRDSSFGRNPLITIDCGRATAKQWNWLLKNENTPLGDSGRTIYFKNLHLLGPRQQKELEQFLQNTRMEKRNRLLF